MTANPKELLPCPFCDGKAKLIKRKPIIKRELTYAITCQSILKKECFLYSGAEERKNDPRCWDDILCWYAKKECAINAWNTRPAQSVTIDREKLAEIIYEGLKRDHFAKNITDALISSQSQWIK